MIPFKDRREAGRYLAQALQQYKNHKEAIVLGLARGGVVVAYEVAVSLSLPLNVIAPRKIGAPGSPELAIGSIMDTGEVIFNKAIIEYLNVSRQYLEKEIELEKKKAQQRIALYRQFAPLPDLKDKTVILVDDGIATGATMLVAIQGMRQANVKHIVVAIPVASSDALGLMEQAADEVVCLYDSEDFGSVGFYYQHFDQTDDEEVLEFLQAAKQGQKMGSAQSNQTPVRIPIGDSAIEGELILPESAKGLVLFAHGSGSSRFSPRNQFVAKYLNSQGLATLLIDLLTMEEDRIDQYTREFRFDIGLLADRLGIVTDWILQNSTTKSLAIGYFGSSTGAAAALIAAAKKGSSISAVVSRGGRPDLASDYLTQVKSPTLFIVGGDDLGVIELNQQAHALLTSEKKLEIIPGAAHLFEEPGALEEVARLAGEWFVKHV